MRLHVCAFEVLDGGQRHGYSARRRAAIVGRRGQLLGVGRAVVLWMLVLLVVVLLLLLMLLDWRERRRTLHLWRGLLLRQWVVVLLLLLVDDGRGRRRAMRRSRGLVVYYCWPACWVLVHGGDRDHSRGGVTCTVAAAVGSLR